MRLLIQSPVGVLLAEYHSGAMTGLTYWENGAHPPAGTRDTPASDDHIGHRIAREIGEYFAGSRKRFEIPIDPAGTPFQRAVWDRLQAIPYGETRSYRQVAAGLDKPGASRAVGQANRRNPLPIIIPCHRILTAAGALGGYMGSTSPSPIKTWLLRHEGNRNFES